MANRTRQIGEFIYFQYMIAEWLNTDVEERYNSLSEEKRLLLRFTLHDNAAISRFKITYIN